jgi:hypothetical protein
VAISGLFSGGVWVGRPASDMISKDSLVWNVLSTFLSSSGVNGATKACF